MQLIQIDQSWFQVDIWWIIIIAIFLVAFIAFAVERSIKAHRRRQSAGKEEMIGSKATVVEKLKPKGVVFLEGERWTAISEEGQIEVDEEVVVTRVESLKVYVVKNTEGGRE